MSSSKKKHVIKRARKVPGAICVAHETNSSEVENFLRSLRHHKQATTGDGPLSPGVTHRIKKKKTAAGSKLVVERKRFSYR